MVGKTLTSMGVLCSGDVCSREQFDFAERQKLVLLKLLWAA